MGKGKAGSGGAGQKVGGRAIRLSVEGMPPKRKPGRPATDWWTLFTQAGKLSGRTRKWVLVAEWGAKSTAYRVRRQIRDGAVDVPAGAEAWEIDVRVTDEGGGQLWVRKGL